MTRHGDAERNGIAGTVKVTDCAAHPDAEPLSPTSKALAAILLIPGIGVALRPSPRARELVPLTARH